MFARTCVRHIASTPGDTENTASPNTHAQKQTQNVHLHTLSLSLSFPLPHSVAPQPQPSSSLPPSLSISNTHNTNTHTHALTLPCALTYTSAHVHKYTTRKKERTQTQRHEYQHPLLHVLTPCLSATWCSPAHALAIDPLFPPILPCGMRPVHAERAHRVPMQTGGARVIGVRMKVGGREWRATTPQTRAASRAARVRTRCYG